jgi:hypothetical protein
MYFLWSTIHVHPLNLPTGPIFLFGRLQVYYFIQKKQRKFMQKLLQKSVLVQFVNYSYSLIHRGSIIKFILMT